MSISYRIARTLLPPKLRSSLKPHISSFYHSLSWLPSPFRTPFQRDMIQLERRKKESPLGALKDFEELRASGWKGLEGFAYQLVHYARPKVIVELGTHMGLSAMAMGLALRDLGEGGRIFAVDSWEGDPHARHYGEDVYQTFLKRIEQLGLGSTIVPLKMYFDQSRDLVEKPIDLLHIDGLHTWDAVKQDFDMFSPLVKPGGLIIFHDVNTLYDDVHRFWKGLSTQYESYTIPYSNGLGILRTKMN